MVCVVHQSSSLDASLPVIGAQAPGLGGRRRHCTD
jgi:hypothetical protein